MSIFSRFINYIRQKRLPEHATNGASTPVQYSINDIRDEISENVLENLYYNELDRIHNIKDLYYESIVHGIEHSERVLHFAVLLCHLDKLNPKIIKLIIRSTIIHDIGRENDYQDNKHGEDGALKAENEGLLNDLTREEKEIVKFAVTEHCKSDEENRQALEKIPFWKRKKYETVLSYLKDADALDRVRIANKHIQLKPELLRHETAKKLVDYAKYFYKAFRTVKLDYKANRTKQKMDPFMKVLYSYIEQYIFDPQWTIDNKDLLTDFYNRGILKTGKETNLDFLNLFADPKLKDSAKQIWAADFIKIRNEGFNITFESFINIVSQYKEGTLDLLRQQGRIEAIFSKDTFEEHGLKKSLRENLTSHQIEANELFQLLNKNQITPLTEEAFDVDYMLYKDLYERFPESFSILIQNGRFDTNIRAIAGFLEVFDINDLYKVVDSGYNFSISDLTRLCADLPPEKYRTIIDSGKIEQLFSYDLSSDKNIPYYYNFVYQGILELFPNIKKEEFDSKYKIYRYIQSWQPLLKTAEGIDKFPPERIFSALGRLQETKDRLALTERIIEFEGKNLIDLLNFDEKTKFLDFKDEEEKDNMISMLIENGNLVNHPSFINYFTKKNKVYTSNKQEDILDYNRFCIEQILNDSEISLEDAKSALINSLFSVVAPFGEYKNEHELNIIDELYFYKRYKEQGLIEVTGDEADIDEAISDLIEIFDCNPTIEDFKKVLADKSKKNLPNIQFDNLYRIILKRMRRFAKKDVIAALQDTENAISQMPTENFTLPDSSSLPIKILNGQDFSLAITTAMPHCSHMHKERFTSNKDAIELFLLDLPLDPDNICVSFDNQDMVAVPQSASENCELRYAFVPNSIKQLSIMGTHDLSSVKINAKNRTIRVNKRPTQNRAMDDLVLGTTEEHNEGVMNGVFPRYIICFDSVSDLATKKYKQLKKEYKKRGLNQKIELVLVKNREKYLPSINKKLEDHMEEIRKSLSETHTVTPELYDRFFNKRGRNITLETLQAINSTSYRDSLWNEQENAKKFSMLGDLLKDVLRVIPKEYLGDLQAQVDFLLRKNRRCYDHSYFNQLNIEQFETLRQEIQEKITGEVPEEKQISGICLGE